MGMCRRDSSIAMCCQRLISFGSDTHSTDPAPGAGSVLWVSDPKEINRWQHIAMDESRLHIPILFGLDVIHGYHTIFPAPIAMASSWDPKMVEDVQSVAAGEAR